MVRPALGGTVLLAFALGPSLLAAPRVGSASGISWSVPTRWIDQPPRPMRAATYTVPFPAGGGEAGECGVFAFGPGQGGTVDANIQRWSSQFEGSPPPERSSQRVNGLAVHRVKISGTFLGGPMMASAAKKPGYRLLGAIVEAREGLVFFKLTGAAPTVAAAQAEFDALLTSLVQGQARP